MQLVLVAEFSRRPHALERFRDRDRRLLETPLAEGMGHHLHIVAVFVVVEVEEASTIRSRAVASWAAMNHSIAPLL